MFAPQALAALLLAAAPSHAQSDRPQDSTIDGSALERFKKGGQRPTAETSVTQVGKVAASDPSAKEKELTIEELTALLKQDGWKVEGADNDEAAPGFRQNVRVLNKDEVGGKSYIVLVPSTVAKHRQLQYRSITTGADGAPLQKPVILQRAFLHGHYLVLQFDSQQQYLSLDKTDQNSGYALAGWVSAKDGVRKFKDPEAFDDAVSRYVKGAPSVRTAKAVASVPGPVEYIEGAMAGRSFIVVFRAGGKTYEVKADGSARPVE